MVTNYLLTGMILQVVGGVSPTHVKKTYARKRSYSFGANFPKGQKSTIFRNHHLGSCSRPEKKSNSLQLDLLKTNEPLAFSRWFAVGSMRHIHMR